MRLQCYEGIDAAEALYEWNYPRQLLGIRAAEASGKPLDSDDLFTPEYLVARPLLKAIEHPGPRPVVLLIDEIDRADDEFEAFLFELMAESSVTIPELGTITAAFPPIVVLTSNRTRDLHDALKRRCLYHWIDYPDVHRATAIVRRRVPAASADLAENVAAAVARLRTLDVQKPPGIAETINWVAALELLGIDLLDGTAVERTLGSVMKYREDLDLVSQRGFAGSRPARTDVGPTVGIAVVDLATVAATFGDRLHSAGIPVTPERSGRFAAAMDLTAPATYDDVYWAARVTLVSGHEQLEQFDRVFGQVFGELADQAETRGDPDVHGRAGDRRHSAPAGFDGELGQQGRRDGAGRSGEDHAIGDDVEGETLAMTASGDEYLHRADYAALTPTELMTLRMLMAQMRLAPPKRNTTTHAAVVEWTNASTCGRPFVAANAREAIPSSRSADGEPCDHDAWSCWPTSPARWSRTLAPTCSCCTVRPAGPTPRPSSSPPA